MSRPETPIFPRMKFLPAISSESPYKTPPSYASRIFNPNHIDPSPPPTDTSMVRSVCSRLEDLLTNKSNKKHKISNELISSVYEEIKEVRHCLKSRSQNPESKRLVSLSLENEDLRSYILRILMNGNDKNSFDLYQFEKYTDKGLSLFKSELQKSLKK